VSREAEPAKALHTRATTVARSATLPLVLSVAAGVLTALLGVSIGLGVIATLLVGVVALQIQILVTIERTDIEAQIALRALAPVTAASNLDAATGDYLVELAEAQVEFLTRSQALPPVFDLELEHQRDVLLEHYEESAQGKVRVNLRASPVLRETQGVSSVKSKLLATSVVPALTYWDTPTGLAYLRQQEGMLEAEVSIKRVFIQHKEDLAELARVIDTHLQWRERYGPDRLDVRVALIDDTLDSDLVVDFAIVDDSTVIRLETQRGIEQPTAVVWEAARTAVDQADRRFERLWSGGFDPASLDLFDRPT
jgi:hypothetical protein